MFIQPTNGFLSKNVILRGPLTYYPNGDPITLRFLNDSRDVLPFEDGEVIAKLIPFTVPSIDCIKFATTNDTD